MIRIPQVRVIDEEGTQLGVMPTPRALEMAQERGFDLVEVAPMAAPPVVRFLDFGQYKYELTKREKDAKKRQRVGFKEVRLTPKIGQGDFDTKLHRAIEFLEDGDRIKVTVRFRGRELTHPEIGRALLTRFTEQIKDHGVVERAPLLEGKQMHLTVASTHKPKAQEAAGQKVQEPKVEQAPAAEATAAAEKPAQAPKPEQRAPAAAPAPKPEQQAAAAPNSEEQPAAAQKPPTSASQASVAQAASNGTGADAPGQQKTNDPRAVSAARADRPAVAPAPTGE